MSEEQMIEKLYDIINNQNVYYITIIAFIVTIFGYFQWHLNKSDLEKLKKNITNDYDKKISKLENRINYVSGERLQVNFKSSKKLIKLDERGITKKIKNEFMSPILIDDENALREILEQVYDIRINIYFEGFQDSGEIRKHIEKVLGNVSTGEVKIYTYRDKKMFINTDREL